MKPEMANSNWSIKKRRAIASIMGMVFFLVVIGVSFTAFITLMNTNSEFLGVQVETSEQEIDRVQEDFVILQVDNGTGSTFRVDVQNKGKTPVEIVDLWIVNRTGGVDCPPCDATVFPINYADSLVPSESTVNILENSAPFSLRSGIYEIKVVSSLGNVAFLSFDTDISPLLATLKTIPPLVSNTANATLVLTVHNNSSKTLYDIIPNNATFTPLTILDGGGFTQNPPLTIEQLDPNESAIFTWNYELRGATGTNVVFTTNATAKSSFNSNRDITSNNANATVTITPKIEEENSSIKPELYVIFPSPGGEARNKNSFNFWGVVLTNPTSESLTVHRVQLGVKSAVSQDHKIIMETDAKGSAGSQHLIHILPCCLEDEEGVVSFVNIATDVPGYTYKNPIPQVDFGPCNCKGVDEVDNVDHRDSNGDPREPPQTQSQWGPDGLPDPIGRWTVPENNLLVWTSHPTQAVVIEPLGAREFVAKIPTGGIPDSNSLIIAANAYTSFGQYSNIGNIFRTNGTESFASIVNVYATNYDVTGFGDEDVVNPENIANFLDRDFVGVINVTAGSTISMNITIREGQDAGNNDVSNQKSGMIRGISEALGLNCSGASDTPLESNLIIGLPPGFSDPIFSSYTNTGFCSPQIITYGDGSKRVISIIENDLGNVAEHTDRRTFRFDLVAPSVETTTQYVITLSTEGHDRWYNPLGPGSVVVLIVRP